MLIINNNEEQVKKKSVKDHFKVFHLTCLTFLNNL